MNTKKILMITAVLIGITGCGAIALQKVEDLNEQRSTELAAEPLLAHIKQQIPLQKDGEPTLEQLADKSLPNVEQRSAIVALDRILSKYARSGLDLIGQTGQPGETAVLQEYFGATKDNRLALYEGRISFGQFNQTAKRLFEIRQITFDKIYQMNAAQAQKAWANAMNSYNASVRRTTNTDCYAVGNSMSCTTR